MTPVDISVVVSLTTKVLVLIGLGLYGIFSGIMIRQEQLMAAVLEEGFEPILRLLTILHFAAAVGLLILAVIIL
ncbi:hypothetical protein HY411_02585 [Candidatus Gottesmanbacteria bacterium]|nr:hypothetical protein [Candidatus Gottesmanbacteria bacterium]